MRSCTTCRTLGEVLKIEEHFRRLPAAVQGSLDGLQIAQSEMIERAISEVGSGMDRIVGVLEWGVEQITWELAQHRSYLVGIDRSLRTPAQTQAREWREMATELLRRGSIRQATDFAVRALEANPLDYFSYITLARTRLAEGDFGSAVESLLASLDHAPRDDAFDYRAYSLRLASRAYFCMDDRHRALHAIAASFSLGNRWALAAYDFCQLLCLYEDEEIELALAETLAAMGNNWEWLGRRRDYGGVAALVLHVAVHKNPGYYRLAQIDTNLDSRRAKIDEGLEMLMLNARNSLQIMITRLGEQDAAAEATLRSQTESLIGKVFRALDKSDAERLRRAQQQLKELKDEVDGTRQQQILDSGDYCAIVKAADEAESSGKFKRVNEMLCGLFRD